MRRRRSEATSASAQRHGAQERVKSFRSLVSITTSSYNDLVTRFSFNRRESLDFRLCHWYTDMICLCHHARKSRQARVCEVDSESRCLARPWFSKFDEYVLRLAGRIVTKIIRVPIYVPRLARPRSLVCKCCTEYSHTRGGPCRWPPRGNVRKTRGRKPGACTAAWYPYKSGTLHLRRPTSDPSVPLRPLRSLRCTFQSGC